jgi:hypothetical protein
MLVALWYVVRHPRCRSCGPFFRSYGHKPWQMRLGLARLPGVRRFFGSASMAPRAPWPFSQLRGVEKVELGVSVQLAFFHLQISCREEVGVSFVALGPLEPKVARN